MTMRAQSDGQGNIIVTDTASPATTPQPSHDEQQPAHTMTGRVTTGHDGNPVIHEPARSVHAHDVLPSDSLLDSATRNGFRVGRGAVRDTDVIEVPALGGSVRVREAVTLGYLRPVHGGGFEEVAQAPAAADEQQHQADEQAPPEDTVRLNDASEAFLADAGSKLGRDAMVSITQAVIEGRDVSNYFPDLGRATGLDKAEVSQRIADVQSALLQQGQEAAVSVGLDMDQWESFAEWSQQTPQKGQRQAAMLALAEYGQTSGVKNLVKAYLASAAGGARYDEKAVLSASFGDGVSVRRALDGRLVVAIPGQGEMRFDQAVAEGRIKVSKRHSA